MMNGSGHMMNGWGYSIMGVGVVAVLALAVLVVLIASRGYFRTGQANNPPATPDQVLATRFARGDIDQDEFIRAQAALKAHRHDMNNLDLK